SSFLNPSRAVAAGDCLWRSVERFNHVVRRVPVKAQCPDVPIPVVAGLCYRFAEAQPIPCRQLLRFVPQPMRGKQSMPLPLQDAVDRGRIDDADFSLEIKDCRFHLSAQAVDPVLYVLATLRQLAPFHPVAKAVRMAHRWTGAAGLAHEVRSLAE